jgi:hypothetical protein
VLTQDLMAKFHAPATKVFPRPFDPFFSDAWQEFDKLSVKDRLDQMGLSADQRALLEGVLGPACCGPFAEAGFVEMLRWWALPGANFQRYGDSVARFKLRDGTVSLLEAILADGRAGRCSARRSCARAGRRRVRVVSESAAVPRARPHRAADERAGNIEFVPALDPRRSPPRRTPLRCRREALRTRAWRGAELRRLLARVRAAVDDLHR